jgi:hypothetical protein
MTKENPLQSEAGSLIHRADDVGTRTRKTLSLQWNKINPVVRVIKDGPFFRVLIDPPIPEGHPDRRPQTFASLATAEREAALIAKIIGGEVVSTAGGHG